MTNFTSCFMNHNDRATAGTSAAANTACAHDTAFSMDAAFVAASIFVILTATGLLRMVGLGVSILVCLILVWSLIMQGSAPGEKAIPVL